MAVSIPGSIAAEWFECLRQEHGVSLADCAKYCGIKKQHITDLRAGRRRFSRRMADNLLLVARHEPWGAWLVPLVESAFSASVVVTDEIVEEKAGAAPFSAQPAGFGDGLPLVKAPVLGDPQQSPLFSGGYVDLPRAAAALVEGISHAYVLALPCDDHARRLRAGDQLLILPLPDTSAEIHVVERGGLLRLARRARDARALGVAVDAALADDEWVALDSGEAVRDARSVGHAAGIVWARL